MFTRSLKSGDAVKLRNVPSKYGFVVENHGWGYVFVEYLDGRQHPAFLNGADLERVEYTEVVKFLSHRIGELEGKNTLAQAQSYFDKRMSQELPRQVQSYIDKQFNKRFPQKVEKATKAKK